MKLASGLFAVSVAIIVGTWWWSGRPVEMPPSPLGRGEKFQCVSYAPFRGSQNPFDVNLNVPAAKIEDDLTRLAQVTNCVRTYAVDNGLDQVPAIAQRHGLKVLQGIWLGREREKNRSQIDKAIALANRYPDVIRAVIVGNEVLLRGELSATDLTDIIHEVKAAVSVPVTYADVWEFWLRNRAIASAVDFVTVHILPYWEDFPIPAASAAAHVDEIHAKVAEAFPGKEILIGEFGWPSAGRMREGALPSPTNQARVLQEVLARARQANYRVNLIEAFDQPWKRQLEGTVGGHWGLLDAETRQPKFVWGQPVSDHPYWPLQAAVGVILAALVFAIALMSRSPLKSPPSLAVWVAVLLNAAVPGVVVGRAIENAFIESLGIGGWIRSAAFVALALATPPIATWALVRGVALPSFGRVLGLASERPSDRLVWALGLAFVGLAVMAIQTALGLVFDPRYLDFPFAPLSAAMVPLLVLTIVRPAEGGPRGVAETTSAVTLALAAVYVALNEGFANWQAVWLAAVFAGCAFTLARSRDAQS